MLTTNASGIDLCSTSLLVNAVVLASSLTSLLNNSWAELSFIGRRWVTIGELVQAVLPNVDVNSRMVSRDDVLVPLIPIILDVIIQFFDIALCFLFRSACVVYIILICYSMHISKSVNVLFFNQEGFHHTSVRERGVCAVLMLTNEQPKRHSP